MGRNYEQYIAKCADGLMEGPLCVQLEISGRCIAKCATCSNKENNENLMHPTFEQNKKIIKSLVNSGVKTIILTGGEPICADRFDDIVDYIIKLGATPCITTTLLTNKESYMNALLKCRIIKVSLSTVGDQYKDFFGIKSSAFKYVRDNIQFLIDNKKRFSYNHTLFNGNIDEDHLMNFIEFANEYKAQYTTFFPALQNDVDQEECIKNLKKVKKYIQFRSNIDNVETHFKRRKSSGVLHCHAQKFTAHIKNNGDVYPCCMTGGEIGQNLNKFFCLGNLYEESMKKIYKKGFDKFDDINMRDMKECRECTMRYLKLNNDYEQFVTDDYLRWI